MSAFGKNTSCISLAINKILNTASPDFKWNDPGIVIQSAPGRDMWNAIDPTLMMDENHTPLAFIWFFWNGLKMVKLDNDFTKIAEPETWFTIAGRKEVISFPIQEPVMPR